MAVRAIEGAAKAVVLRVIVDHGVSLGSKGGGAAVEGGDAVAVSGRHLHLGPRHISGGGMLDGSAH